MKIGSVDITSERIIVALAVLINIQGGIGHGSVSLTHMVPAEWVDTILAWNNFLAYAGTLIIGAVAAPGALAGRPLPQVSASTVVKIVIGAFILALFLPVGSAQAATKAPLQLTGNVQADFKANHPSSLSTTGGASGVDILSKLEQIKAEIVTDVIADIQAADDDAGTVITPAVGNSPAVVNDPIAHACYPAEIQFLQTLPVAKPLTGKLTGVQLFQRKRDFINQLRMGLPAYLKIGCGAMIGDETKIFITTLGMVGVTVATGGVAGILPAVALPAIPALNLP